MMTAQIQLKQSKNLTDLLNNLVELHQEGREDEIQMTSLPLFGGQEPEHTLGVWSWDEEHLLIGEGWSDFMIVNRADWRN